MTHPVDLKNFTLPELEQLLAAWGQPAFRARQLVKWLYKGAGAFEDMTDIARPFRAELSTRARISSLEVEQVQAAADGCRKFLFALEDGNLIEAVLIPEEGHYTLMSWGIVASSGDGTIRRGCQRRRAALAQPWLPVSQYHLPSQRPVARPQPPDKKCFEDQRA